MVDRPTFRALVVSAHPDDIEFGCAGTIAKWTAAGAEVTYCIVTDGSTGTQDRELVGRRLTELRREESRRAAETVGVFDVEWLGYRDGYLDYTLDLRRDIARVFRRARPHRYLVIDPATMMEDRFVNHPDHRVVGHASLDVTLTAGTTPGHFPELLDEGLEPWRGLRELWIMGPATQPTVVDITETIDKKIDALMCHASQVGDNAEEVSGWVREWTAGVGGKHGFAHAESFRVLREGPGFHSGEQDDEADLTDLPPAPVDPRSTPPR
jgi:LmbE family N-acetylglucosaminyl deacetylase